MLRHTHIYQEIHQQPHILQTLIDKEEATLRAVVAAIRKRDVRFVLIAARGTSDNAGRHANYAFGALNRLPVALAAPSLYTIYGQTPRLKDALVIGVSQSGRSPDIVSVVEDAAKQGALTVAITNAGDSNLAKQAEYVVELHAGEERSVAATKTYTGQLMAMALLNALLNGDPALREEIAAIPDAVAKVLDVNEQVEMIAPRYRYMRDCVVIGRGYNYATAFEMALKLKELTYTMAEPYSSADFLHGPLALVDRGFPVVVIAPSGKMLEGMQSFIQVARDHGAETIVVSDDAATLAAARIRLPLAAAVPEWLSPLTAIVPGQLLAMHLAATRDYDPDQPRGLRKVTETL